MTAPVLKLEEGKLHKRPDLFGKVFAALIHDLTISDGAIRLYAHMHWRYGANHKMFESIGTMAKALGVTDKVIKQRIAELAASGWIVVIARRANGKVTSNFYHIFERTRDSRTFRKTYKPAEGETILPAPVLAARKSRKGIGGKNTHKVKPAVIQVPMVAVVTQVPADGDTQVSTDGDTQVPTNQTQDNQTQIIQTQEIAAIAAVIEFPAKEFQTAFIAGLGYTDAAYKDGKFLKQVKTLSQLMFDFGFKPTDVPEFINFCRTQFKNKQLTPALIRDMVLPFEALRTVPLHIMEEDAAPVHTPSTIAPDTKVIGDMTAAEFDALTDAERQAQIDLKLASIAGRIVGTEGGRRGREAARNELDELNKSA
jgi:hypothetical protein